MKKRLILISIFLFVSLLSGCRPSSPKVAVTSYPVEYLVKKIGGDYVSVTNISSDSLIQRATIKDDYEAVLDASDVLFYIGGLEPYMELYLDDIRSARIKMIDLSSISALNQFKRYTSINLDGKLVTAETPWYEGDIFKNIDMYDKDPILWIDPISMSSMGSSICSYLSDKYPEYAKIFNQNFDSLMNDLARIDADYQSIKDEGLKISFVSVTPSFGNWQKSYGIKVYPICLSKYGAMPTSAQLKAMKDRIQQDGVRYIVKEPNLPEDMLKLHDQLVSELGLISVSLSNISSLSEEEKKNGVDYRSLMYENLKVLEEMAD
ncbi:MAG: zinc ABC transporter solute-binding protein [Erysipelotrichaceae bacterium]|nr:zinc ABC transporter solute-binding protein [Erysipelotrichaceae bacterium]